MQVSVICTARNAAATIGRTLASVLAQDMAGWELVVVDDGSSDETAAIVAAVARHNERVRLIRTPGIGRMPALNLALSEARAPLVANIDADDECHPARLRLQLAALRRHPEFALVDSGVLLIRDDERPRWPPWANEVPPPVVEITGRLALHNPICHSAVLMRRAAVLAVGGYRHPLVDDYELWVRLAEAGHRLGQLTHPLVAHRIHAGQWFLHAPRPSYLLEVARIQARAIRALGARRRSWGLLALRVLWGFLPLSVRLRWHDRGQRP